MSDQPSDDPYAPPPPGWTPPNPSAPQPPPAYAPMPPPYAAPPGWQPPPPPYGVPPAGGLPPGAAPVDPWGPPPAPPAGWPPPQQQPYGAPPGWGPQQPYGQQPYGQQQPWGNYHPGYGYYPPQRYSGFAIAGFVCSILLSFLCGVGSVLGVVFGILGLRQCRREGSRGRGLAIASIVIGGLGIAFWILALIVGVASSGSSDGGSGLGAHAALVHLAHRLT